jgi:hypothetical protein
VTDDAVQRPVGLESLEDRIDLLQKLGVFLGDGDRGPFVVVYFGQEDEVLVGVGRPEGRGIGGDDGVDLSGFQGHDRVHDVVEEAEIGLGEAGGDELVVGQTDQGPDALVLQRVEAGDSGLLSILFRGAGKGQGGQEDEEQNR